MALQIPLFASYKHPKLESIEEKARRIRNEIIWLEDNLRERFEEMKRVKILLEAKAQPRLPDTPESDREMKKLAYEKVLARKADRNERRFYKTFFEAPPSHAYLELLRKES